MHRRAALRRIAADVDTVAAALGTLAGRAVFLHRGLILRLGHGILLIPAVATFNTIALLIIIVKF